MDTDQSEVRPRVSIAMASFNGEKFIVEQLDSLAAQTMLPYELVIADDGSSDQTLQIVEAFSMTAPFKVRVYGNLTRLGYGDNFLRAARLCDGELVAFCDQDDVWLEDKVARCAAMFDDQEIMLCIHTSRLWYGGKDFGAKFHEFPMETIVAPLRLNPLHTFPGFAMMFRRDLLGLCDSGTRPFSIYDRPPAMMSHDQWAWLLACVFGNIALLPQVLSWYRQHEGNARGAPRALNVLQVLSKSATSVDYRHFALIEDQCAGLFANIPCLSDSHKARADRAAAYFRTCAAIHRWRAKIYAAESGLTQRIGGFLSIFVLRGYFGSRSGCALGWRALLKDVLYGIPGVHKLRFARIVPRPEAEDGAGG
jgi:glycosyltransferase involved in cell wall biosynthesis